MKTTFSPGDYPQLGAFARGYLHEDFKLDFPTPERALDDFRKHGKPEQIAALKREFEVFMSAANAVPFGEVQTWWTRGLGSAWLPADKNRLLELQRHLSQDDK